MGRVFHNKKMPKPGAEKTDKIFDGKKKAKLGTETRPAVVNVQTEERSKEVASLFEENGWAYAIELEPDKPENITDLEKLLHPPQPIRTDKKVGRNDACPCGSGQKHKKCCGLKHPAFKGLSAPRYDS